MCLSIQPRDAVRIALAKCPSARAGVHSARRCFSQPNFHRGMRGFMAWPSTGARLVGALLLALASSAGGQSIRDFHVPEPLPERSVLVIGFLGGFEKWNDP